MIILYGYGPYFQEASTYIIGGHGYNVAVGTISTAPTFENSGGAVVARHRRFDVPAQNRTFVIPAQAREFKPGAKNR